MIQIINCQIDVQSVLESVKCSEAGAVVTFDGTVRNHCRGKSVTHLFYEAYELMAEAILKSIRNEALKKWSLQNLAIIHRVGRLEIGDSSVFIAAVADHRVEAFEACRFVIDSLKTKAPIWKKEYYQNGEIWVEGYSDILPPQL